MICLFRQFHSAIGNKTATPSVAGGTLSVIRYYPVVYRSALKTRQAQSGYPNPDESQDDDDDHEDDYRDDCDRKGFQPASFKEGLDQPEPDNEHYDGCKDTTPDERLNDRIQDQANDDDPYRMREFCFLTFKRPTCQPENGRYNDYPNDDLDY